MSPVTVNPGSFVSKSRSEVVSLMLERLPKLTDYTYKGDGSLVRSILEVVGKEIGDVYGVIDYTWAQQIVKSANGANLDALGYLYNVPRRAVSGAETQSAFYFYLNTSSNHQAGIPNTTAGTQFTVPQGTVITTRDDSIGDAMSFTTNSAVTFLVGDSVRYVSVTPFTTTIRHDIAQHQLRVHDYAGTGDTILYCTNPVEIATSTIIEPDETYRARIIAAVRSMATSNIIAVRMAALSVAHVQDAKVINRPWGPATARVVFSLDPGANGTELDLITIAVNEARPAGTYVRVEQATGIPVAITFGIDNGDLRIRDQSAALRAVESAIRTNIGRLGIGDYIRRNTLIKDMSIACPVASDVYIISMKINEQNFIGDTWPTKEDEVPYVFSVSGNVY